MKKVAISSVIFAVVTLLGSCHPAPTLARTETGRPRPGIQFSNLDSSAALF